MTRVRTLFLMVFLFFVFALVLIRAAQLQLMPHDKVQSLAERQLQQTIEINGRRGAVLDRHGRELAVSVNSMSIFANPRLIRDPERLAKVLSQALGVPPQRFVDRIKGASRRRFVWLERQLSPLQLQRLQELDLKQFPGVGLLPEFRREYPLDHIASHVLGFVDVDGKGREGLERALDDLLRGSRGSVKVARDALGRPLFSQRDQIRFELHQGATIETTLDSQIQFAAEKALDEAIAFHGAEGGSVVVLEPQGAELLALVNRPTFNLNRASVTTPSERRNRAITDPIEPGSVVKPFVVARALERGIAKATQMIPTHNGILKIGRNTIRESDPKHYRPQMSVADIVRYSSNVGTVVLAQRLGAEDVYSTFRSLGFGQRSRSGLPGESPGLLPQWPESRRLENATFSFGQGFSGTALQIAAAFSVFANQGKYQTPKLVRRVLDDQGREVEGPWTKPELRTVFSKTTVEQMNALLQKVVHQEGTGSAARIEGFRVAGKTGTSQRVDFEKGGYEEGAYWSSFIGFLPAESPRYLIYVMIDRPRRNGYYGGVVAAPVFAQIARVALRQAFPISPDRLEQSIVEPIKLRTSQSVASATSEVIPDFVGLPLPQVLRLAAERGILVRVHGEGRFVGSQLTGKGSVDVRLR
jgi:cell division protein FtsI (penicillin-binding protein 3)